MIEIVQEGIDTNKLYEEMKQLLSEQKLWDQTQVSLTSISGNNDWDCSIGKSAHLPKPEKYYCVVNQALKNTYIEDLILQYKKYYRWRLLCVPPKNFYSVHSDAKRSRKDGETSTDFNNWRIHIPVFTNSKAYFCYYGQQPADGVTTDVSFHHLRAGKVYRVNTTNLHSAINYGSAPRYHIVGVKYERTDNSNDT